MWDRLGGNLEQTVETSHKLKETKEARLTSTKTKRESAGQTGGKKGGGSRRDWVTQKIAPPLGNPWHVAEGKEECGTPRP